MVLLIAVAVIALFLFSGNSFEPLVEELRVANFNFNPLVLSKQDQFPFAPTPEAITPSPSIPTEENTPNLPAQSNTLPSERENTPALQNTTTLEPIPETAYPVNVEWLPPNPTQQNSHANTVLTLQSNRSLQRIKNTAGDEIVLTNLNPRIGVWYLLAVNIRGLKNTLHLEVQPIQGTTELRPRLFLYADGLGVAMDHIPPHYFPLWPAPGTPSTACDTLNDAPVPNELLAPDHVFDSPYTVICGGLVLIRIQKKGVSTKMELVTDLLRETRLGDWFVEKAKPHLLPAPELVENATISSPVNEIHPAAEYPRNAAVNPSKPADVCAPTNLGIANEAPDGKMTYGSWYKAVHHPGVYLSVYKASETDPSLLGTYKDRVDALGRYDKTHQEAESLVYLLAFDLDHYGFGYAVGADHPRVDGMPNNPKGPDGFDTVKPLVRIGSIPPYDAPRAVAAFSGGFKREHGVFHAGPFAKTNGGNYYGFMEKGVILSRLNPGLATAWMDVNGELRLLTWPEAPGALLETAYCIRQNGVPIIEGIDPAGISIPGGLVNKWGAGNWSGSQQGNFLTLRSAIALQDTPTKHFLLYAYFTGATSNAMARIFQAYNVRYAMQLDMNTLSLCYAALYLRDETGALTGAEYLHNGMREGEKLRFLQTNDTRDLFYVLRKQ